MSSRLAVLVLAAGLGKRTKSSTPKVLLPLCGRTLLDCVLDTVAELQPEQTIVVVHHGKERVERAVAARPDAANGNLRCVDQGAPRGTGHAARVACEALGEFAGDVMIVYGDMALVRAESLQELREARANAAAAILTAEPGDPSGLGRIVRDDEGRVVAIREERDCSPEELAIEEINAGCYCVDGSLLAAELERLQPNNAQGESCLTDVVGSLIAQGKEVAAVVAEDHDEVQGVNSLAELALARSIMQERILLQHLENGVHIEDPGTTFIDHGVRIGRDTRILPCTVIRRGAVIGEGCEVGPFAQLRGDTVLEDGAEIGNFVEVKQCRIGAGAKAKHLSYLGDASVGRKANIGAGTITANYDGKHKHRTVIGDDAFIGSGTVLVAPSQVGAAAMTGAGAIVKRGSEVPAGEVWVGVPARRLRGGGVSEQPGAAAGEGSER